MARPEPPSYESVWTLEPPQPSNSSSASFESLTINGATPTAVSGVRNGALSVELLSVPRSGATPLRREPSAQSYRSRQTSILEYLVQQNAATNRRLEQLEKSLTSTAGETISNEDGAAVDTLASNGQNKGKAAARGDSTAPTSAPMNSREPAPEDEITPALEQLVVTNQDMNEKIDRVCFALEAMQFQLVEITKLLKKGEEPRARGPTAYDPRTELGQIRKANLESRDTLIHWPDSRLDVTSVPADVQGLAKLDFIQCRQIRDALGINDIGVFRNESVLNQITEHLGVKWAFQYDSGRRHMDIVPRSEAWVKAQHKYNARSDRSDNN